MIRGAILSTLGRNRNGRMTWLVYAHCRLGKTRLGRGLVVEVYDMLVCRAGGAEVAAD